MDRFSVHRNPTFSTAQTATSIRPSVATLVLLSTFTLLSVLLLFTVTSKVVQAALAILFLTSLCHLVTALLSLLRQKNPLTEHHLHLLGLRPSKSPVTNSEPDPLGKDYGIPIRKVLTCNTSTSCISIRPTSTNWTKPTLVHHLSPLPTVLTSMPSSGRATAIKTEAQFEQFLAESDAKFMAVNPSRTINRFNAVRPGTVSLATSGWVDEPSRPLRPVMMPSSFYQKQYCNLPYPMSMEQTVETLNRLGIPEKGRDRLRQWCSVTLLHPLLHKIENSHVQVIQAVADGGVTININKVGTERFESMDEDDLLDQLRAALEEQADGSVEMDSCLNAVMRHQVLKKFVSGQLIRGLLPCSTDCSDYIVQRVRYLAEGSCLKNYDYTGSHDLYETWMWELLCDSRLLMYVFCAFLLNPPVYSFSAHLCELNPLFLGGLPPKERIPDKYVAIISGVPSTIHPGACVLSVGNENPPVFNLYWDEKLQFCLQGRTALWDALLFFCHRIKVADGGIIRGVHLGSSDVNLLSVLDENND